MTSLSKLLPKKIGPVVITFGFVIYLLGSVFHDVFFSTVDPFAIADSERTLEWSFRLVRNVGLILGFGGMVTFGIRTLREEGFSPKKLIMPAIGLIFLACMTLFVFYTSAAMKSTFDKLEIPSMNIERFREKANDQNISMVERSRFSEFYARLKYDEDGTAIEYLTPNGEMVIYRPSEKQIKIRQELLQNKKKLTWLHGSLNNAGFFWTAVAITSLLLGFFPGRRFGI